MIGTIQVYERVVKIGTFYRFDLILKDRIFIHYCIDTVINLWRDYAQSNILNYWLANFYISPDYIDTLSELSTFEPYHKKEAIGFISGLDIFVRYNHTNTITLEYDFRTELNFHYILAKSIPIIYDADIDWRPKEIVPEDYYL